MMQVADFDYALPSELIAQYPAKVREHSRLMVVERASGKITHTIFARIPDWLLPSDVLVVNDTRVIPARLHGRKFPGGGKVEIFLLRQREETVWEILIGGKVRPGTRVEFGAGELTGIIQEKGGAGKGIVVFEPRADLKATLYRLGETPLPPYIHRDEGMFPEDHDRYQTVYARHEGAVAAPTAGLHFSEQLLDAIREKGIEIVSVTLHVGIGTFQPVKVEHVEEHQIAPEWYELCEYTAERLNCAVTQGRRIMSVGTTSTRLIEAVYAQYGSLSSGSGWADIFIYPGFQFRVTNALITNFHLPKSSLLMLVSAFGGMELMRRAYQEAIDHRYRFYSYGDAMLIL